jgi:hypothetical protein
LSGREIVELLLNSADDAGVDGTDSIFGRGILNIARAFEPQGATTLAGSTMAMALTGNGTSSGPLGDSLSRGGPRAIILDRYRRAYQLDLGKTVGRVAADKPLTRGLDSAGYQSASGGAGPVSFNLTVRRNRAGSLRGVLEPARLDGSQERAARAVAGMAVGRLSPKTMIALGISQSARALQRRLSGQWGEAFLVAEDPAARAGFQANPASSLAMRHRIGPIGVTVASERGRQWDADAAHRLDRSNYRSDSLALDGREGRLGYNFGLSRLEESQSILGSRFASTFLSGGSRTLFLDGSARFSLGSGWEAEGSYRRGWTTAETGGGLVRSARLTSDAFAAKLAKSGLLGSRDRIAFQVSQPLRVVGGGFGLHLPVDYSYATRTAVYGDRFMSLAPDGREIDYEMVYSLGLFGGQFDLNAFVRSDPGHVAAMKRDSGAAIRFKIGL